MRKHKSVVKTYERMLAWKLKQASDLWKQWSSKFANMADMPWWTWNKTTEVSNRTNCVSVLECKECKHSLQELLWSNHVTILVMFTANLYRYSISKLWISPLLINDMHQTRFTADSIEIGIVDDTQIIQKFCVLSSLSECIFLDCPALAPFV